MRAKNKRRYLNGQVIIQEQFPAFTAAVKARMTTMANAFTTEVNWQAEKTQSKLGQCGKFVVDDTAGTIRLPCVVNAQGLADLALIGGIKSESLPNITGEVIPMGGHLDGYIIRNSDSGDGALFIKSADITGKTGQITSGTYGVGKIALDSSRSSSAYQDNAPVQQEAVQYPYCIVVNTGIEETDRPINNYQVNNVYSYGMSQYYKGTMNNNSWLKSAGQWNDGTVYTGMYNWLIEQMNNGVDGFKGTIGYAWKSQTADLRFWTAIRNPSVGCAVYGGVGIPFAGSVTAINPDGTLNFYEVSTGITYENLVYTESENIDIEGTAFGNLKFANDYDFVINTTDRTFRLPLKNGDENLPDYENGVDISTYTDATSGFVCPANGIVNAYVGGTSNIGGQVYLNGEYYNQLNVSSSFNGQITLQVRTGDIIKVRNPITSPAFSSNYINRYFPNKGNGNLYYYIGDTLQNAQLINVARIEEKLTDMNATSRGYVIESYHNGTEWYRIYSDGWCEQGFYDTTHTDHVVTLLTPMADANYIVSIGQSGNGASAQVGRSTWKEKTATTLKINSVTPTDWVIAGYKA